MSAIRSLATGEHTLIGDIIGDSFADDPVNNFVFTRTPGLSAYYTLIARKLYLRQGYGHVAGNDGGALWLPPGTVSYTHLRAHETAYTIAYGGMWL